MKRSPAGVLHHGKLTCEGDGNSNRLDIPTIDLTGKHIILRPDLLPFTNSPGIVRDPSEVPLAFSRLLLSQLVDSSTSDSAMLG